MTEILTPKLHLKLDIINTIVAAGHMEVIEDLDTAEKIEAAWDQAVEDDLHWDPRNELRQSGELTNITPDSSRHYESESVAKKFGDVWIGWTYWHGGGKHSDPDSIDWMDQAYFLDIAKEEPVTITKRTFAKKSVSRCDDSPAPITPLSDSSVLDSVPTSNITQSFDSPLSGSDSNASNDYLGGGGDFGGGGASSNWDSSTSSSDSSSSCDSSSSSSCSD